MLFDCGGVFPTYANELYPWLDVPASQNPCKSRRTKWIFHRKSNNIIIILFIGIDCTLWPLHRMLGMIAICLPHMWHSGDSASNLYIRNGVHDMRFPVCVHVWIALRLMANHQLWQHCLLNVNAFTWNSIRFVVLNYYWWFDLHMNAAPVRLSCSVFLCKMCIGIIDISSTPISFDLHACMHELIANSILVANGRAMHLQYVYSKFTICNQFRICKLFAVLIAKAI